MGNIAKQKAFILSNIGKIDPSGDNLKMYEALFKRMTDKEFREFIEDDARPLPLTVTHDNKTVTVRNNMKIAKSLGKNFIQHLVIEGEEDYPTYKTPEKYLLLKLLVRRASQILTKKISIPTHTKSFDMTTGQVTGDSKASKMTAPEMQMLTGMGLVKSLVELSKHRGGDMGSLNAMNQYLYKYGEIDHNILENHSTGVVSTKTLDAYLKASHIKSTLTTR